MRTYHGTQGVTRALQSRIAKRGKFIANMEAVYIEQRDIGRQIAEAGALPKHEALKPARLIRADIKVIAEEQKLDRDTLLALYHYGVQHIENDYITKQRKREARVKAREAALAAATTPVGDIV